MKIVVLASHTPSLFWFRLEMMKAFIEKGHKVVAVGNEEESKWQKKFEENGIKYRRANIVRNGTNPISDIKTFFSLLKLLKEESPDKIFTCQAKTVIYGLLAAKFLGIKEIYPLIAGVGSIFLGDSLKIKIVRCILVAEYKLALRKCPIIFFQNNDDINTFKGYKIIRKQKTVILNGSGVDVDKFAYSDLPNKFAILLIGRLIRDKGIVEYLEACRLFKEEHPDVKCMLVGPFDTNPTALSKDELDKYINDGIIEYYGEQENVFPYLKACSVYVLPSYREGTPKTVLEAMAVGRPIITTNAPGCKETVENGVNGFLVPIKDVNSIFEKLTELYNNREMQLTMAKNSRKIAENKYNVNIVNNQIMKIMNI